MDTQSLNAFLAIAEHHSFSIAAEKLHLTQPAISKRIASLEQQLDCRLFDRIGRKVSLTEAGRALLPRARKILMEITDATQALQDLPGQVSGQLSLGISHHIGLHRLPPVLHAFAQQFPEVDLDISFMDSEKAYNAILQGNLELGVVTLSPFETEKITTIPIWPDPLVFLVADEHPLASMKNITLQTLLEHRSILPGLTTYTGQIVDDLFRQQQLALDFSHSTNYLETIRMMVSIGLGWSVLPKTMCNEGLTELHIKSANMQRTLGCVFHQERSLSNAAQQFIQLLQNHTQSD